MTRSPHSLSLSDCILSLTQNRLWSLCLSLSLYLLHPVHCVGRIKHHRAHKAFESDRSWHQRLLFHPGLFSLSKNFFNCFKGGKGNEVKLYKIWVQVISSALRERLDFYPPFPVSLPPWKSPHSLPNPTIIYRSSQMDTTLSLSPNAHLLTFPFRAFHPQLPWQVIGRHWFLALNNHFLDARQLAFSTMASSFLAAIFPADPLSPQGLPWCPFSAHLLLTVHP